ncbi:MAG: hypothetical protein GQ474_04475, partial [Sulfurimonas sp.]|nr:hypothetical protein [Sulfurimonas sp.]
MLKKLGLLAVCAASAFAMHSVELNINDKDLEFGARIDMGQFNDTVEPDSVFVGAKILHGSVDNSEFSSSSDMQDYIEASFLMQRKVEATDLVIGLGVKLNGTKNFSSIPLGAEASYKLAFSDKMPLYIRGAVYYAPEILSMQDAKNFLEYRAALDLEVIKN